MFFNEVIIRHYIIHYITLYYNDIDVIFYTFAWIKPLCMTHEKHACEIDLPV